MTKDRVMGFLRHGLTFLGGIAVTRGYVDEQALPELVGAIITIAGFIWSFQAKKVSA